MDPITITPQTVTAVRLAVTLSEEQARAVLVDPAPFQRLLRDALQAHGSRNPLNERRSAKLGRPAKEQPAKAGAPATGKLGPKGKGPKPLGLTIACPDCPKRFKNDHALAVHRARKHAPAAESPASA